jgi:pyruvate dehydrogenase E2 component (dihydrolipoamide acetyltransferase)
MIGSENSYQVVMPRLGLTMTEATIVEWHKGDGDRVEKGELLFTIESDKVTLEIEAPARGVLGILVPAGRTVPVLEPVGILRITHGESRITHRASPKARALARRLGISLEGIVGTGPRGMIVAADLDTQEARERLGAPARPAVKASPVARRMAAQATLDLADVSGSGPGGRIMRHDVERSLRQTQDAVLAAAPSRVAMKTRTAESPVPPETVGELQPLSGLREAIAERLSASWRERPHVTLTTEADATNLVSARQQAIVELGEKVSYNAFLVTLVARALREHPHVNCRLTEAGIARLAQTNIGVAVDTERGLLVPVVRDAASKNLIQVHRALQELIERAVAGHSLPDDLTGGTFTITNLGPYEIDAFTPIINPPESAILGVGRIVARPVAVGGQVVLRDVVTLSLSFDHRLIDGAPAARFLQRVKQIVERPFALALLG